MKKNKTRFIPGFLIGMLAMAVVVAGVGAGIYLSDMEKKESSVKEASADKIETLQEIIDAYYLDDIDLDALEDGVYKGLVDGLDDPYSVYYTKDEYSDMLEDSSGIYDGLGMLVSQDETGGDITIIQVFEDTPAYEAGVKSGDVIFKVEDEEVKGQDLSTVVSRMKGEKGTSVDITLYRESVDKYLEFNITRDEINVPTVSYKMLDNKNKIGYVQIVQFDEVTYKQFKKAMNALEKKGMEAVIFDLRDNPGGLYDTVCDILDYILPEGRIVYTKDKYGNMREQTSDEECVDIPIVVLQNENSASASEIFSGAVKDFGVGTIVGAKSFGKGIVQSVFPLGDGTAIKLTVEDYYTPNGNNINGTGITPDIEVENTNDKEDAQLERAKKTAVSLVKNKK